MRRSLVKSPSFFRAAKRYLKSHPAGTNPIQDALALLVEDAFAPRLKTHKLNGGLANCWAASAGYDLRIVFELIQEGGTEKILLLSVGTHDEVY